MVMPNGNPEGERERYVDAIANFAILLRAHERGDVPTQGFAIAALDRLGISVAVRPWPEPSAPADLN